MYKSSLIPCGTSKTPLYIRTFLDIKCHFGSMADLSVSVSASTFYILYIHVHVSTKGIIYELEREPKLSPVFLRKVYIRYSTGQRALVRKVQ